MIYQTVQTLSSSDGQPHAAWSIVVFIIGVVIFLVIDLGLSLRDSASRKVSYLISRLAGLAVFLFLFYKIPAVTTYAEGQYVSPSENLVGDLFVLYVLAAGFLLLFCIVYFIWHRKSWSSFLSKVLFCVGVTGTILLTLLLLLFNTRTSSINGSFLFGLYHSDMTYFGILIDCLHAPAVCLAYILTTMLLCFVLKAGNRYFGRKPILHKEQNIGPEEQGRKDQVT